MFSLLIMISLAMLFFILGFFVWKKEKINLVHSYHYTKVSEEDKKYYTEQIGKSLIVISIGLVLTGITEFITTSPYSWIFFSVFFVLAFIKMSKAQKKYNKGWF